MKLEVIGNATVLAAFVDRLQSVGGNPFMLLAPTPQAPLLDRYDRMAELYMLLSTGARKASELPLFANKGWPAETENVQAMAFMRTHVKNVEERARAFRHAVEVEGVDNVEAFLQQHIGFSATVQWEPEDSEFTLNGEVRFASEADDDKVDRSFLRLAQRFSGLGFLLSGYHKGRMLQQSVRDGRLSVQEDAQSLRQALVHDLGLS